MTNVHFIGGIHGVGKGTICRKICEQTGVKHLIASELLKWNEISAMDNKNVANISNTQDRLLKGLQQATKEDKTYLLDGHFCLFNAVGAVEKVPFETFKKIKPKSILVVTNSVDVIKRRLENRDNRNYDLHLLTAMQKTEVSYAKEIALKLSIPFTEIADGNCNSIIELVK